MKIDNVGKNRVVIDGREFRGRNISIENDRVIVDGVVQSGSLVGPVNVTVHGDAQRVEASGEVHVRGNCGDVQTVSGDVRTDRISGGVSTVSGDVHAKVIHGSVSSVSGDIG